MSKDWAGKNVGPYCSKEPPRGGNLKSTHHQSFNSYYTQVHQHQMHASFLPLAWRKARQQGIAFGSRLGKREFQVLITETLSNRPQGLKLISTKNTHSASKIKDKQTLMR